MIAKCIRSSCPLQVLHPPQLARDLPDVVSLWPIFYFCFDAGRRQCDFCMKYDFFRSNINFASILSCAPGLLLSTPGALFGPREGPDPNFCFFRLAKVQPRRGPVTAARGEGPQPVCSSPGLHAALAVGRGPPTVSGRGREEGTKQGLKKLILALSGQNSDPGDARVGPSAPQIVQIS